jgi:hypothetical protein
MISGYHDLYLRPWFALRVFALPVAVRGVPGVQVIVSDICQFDALEDPEDRPPSVLSTMLSGMSAVRSKPVLDCAVRGWAPVIRVAR